MYSLETFLFKRRGESAPSVCPKSFLLNWDPLMVYSIAPTSWKDMFPLVEAFQWLLPHKRTRNKSGMSILGALTMLSSGQCLTCIVCATHTGKFHRDCASEWTFKYWLALLASFPKKTGHVPSLVPDASAWASCLYPDLYPDQVSAAWLLGPLEELPVSFLLHVLKNSFLRVQPHSTAVNT